MARRRALSGRQGTRTRPRFAFVRETASELRKVVWPTRNETINMTIIVIVVSVLVGIGLGLVDLGFSELMDILLLR